MACEAYPELRTHGFAQALRKAFLGRSDAIDAVVEAARVVPDAYEVTPERVVVVEVVVWNGLNTLKTNAYGDLKRVLGDAGIDFGVWVVDSLGRTCELALVPLS